MATKGNVCSVADLSCHLLCKELSYTQTYKGVSYGIQESVGDPQQSKWLSVGHTQENFPPVFPIPLYISYKYERLSLKTFYGNCSV